MKAARAAVKPRRALGSADSKLNDWVFIGRDAHPGSFGGHQSLKIEEIEQGGLDKLGFRQRGVTRTIGSWGKTKVPSGTA